ncbi:SDR family oxidoreductase [Laspinema sp. C5]|uniref:SDR family oxidoreductase n=2 Tax=Laspinema TaxID=2584823 RepID=A0ABT2N4E6_9CYAN|nr:MULTISPECIES: SDR family oxidoreductase [unclassified Laspinema]MCT7972810.1 SDR family oxidoreductase [Laspinema sp. D3d]MCT7976650.1 SDR family oxidoreductase [Laspinema sp. D3b]MCT7990104.1 SDR family oxidoreductase [Laspinema sp. D3a]MCT7995652.1 SDR family oxidoreductase [Laspinema sp. D3c]
MGLNIGIIGCGYVGTAVARRWREFGHSITATTTRRDRIEELEQVAQQVVVLQGNDSEALASLVQNQDIILLTVGAHQSNLYRETYLDTANTLVPVLREAPRVQQLIYTSSYSVYGDQQGAWVDETTPVKPVNENSQIIDGAEQVLLSAQSDRLNVCILRLGGIYGPNRELVRILSRFAGTTRPGSGDEWSNWIHLEDIVEAIIFVCRQRCQGIYNLVNDVPLPMRELLDRLCQQHGVEAITWDPSLPSLRPYHARVSNQKLKRAGFELRYPETML